MGHSFLKLLPLVRSIEKHDIPSLNHPTTVCQGQQGARRLKYKNQLPSAKQFGKV